MSGNEQEKLYQLSDVDKNNEIYKLFEEEINFLNHFFSFEKYAKKINKIDNLQEFINDPIFIDFQQHFKTFIQNSGFNYFSSLFKFLSFLFKIRPKYLPILILIIPIAFDYYSSHLKEIKNYLSAQSSKYLLYPLLVKILNEDEYFTNNLFNKSTEDINIKLIQEELLQHPEYLTLCSYMPEFKDPQELINSQGCIKKIDKRIEKIFSIIIQDDYNELISFLAKNSDFDIHKNIDYSIPDLLSKHFRMRTISLLDLCCFFASNNCFKYFYINSCKFSSKTNKYCIIGGNYEILQILNQNKIDFNNCLSFSIEYHQYTISEWLLSNYEVEHVFATDCIPFYNMQFFIFNHYNTFHDYNLLPEYIEPTENESSYIHEFCSIGSFPIVEYLIKNGHNKEYQDEDRSTPLHIACEEGHFPVVEYLIRNGCNKESTNIIEFTPLHDACKNGHLPIVEYLVTNGCSLESESYRAPLHIACKYGHLSIIEYLITNGCNKYCKDESGKTLLHIACEKGYLPIVEYLISSGYNKECQDESGRTP